MSFFAATEQADYGITSILVEAFSTDFFPQWSKVAVGNNPQAESAVF